MKVSFAFDSYCRDVIVFGNQSRKTEENHNIVKKNLVTFTNDIEIEDLTFSTVRDWKIALDKHRSPETVRNYIIKLRVVLAYLQKQGYDVLDPDTIPVPKRTDKVPDFVTKEDVARLIECTGKIRNKAIISLLYASGIRVSELCSLDIDSIRDNRFTIVGKGGKARLCFIDARTASLLKKYVRTRKDNHSALFVSNKGRITPGTVQEIFKYARKKTGLPNVHPHTMRHSFATNLLQGGIHIYSLSRLMGHASISTTQTYLHVTDIDLEKAYSRHHTI